jgi:hypothetical protein
VQKWEYLTSSSPDLRQLGAEGWELVAVEAGTFYFKRPAPTLQERITREQREQVYREKGVER